MIISRLTGGLGNQLFQYAFGRSLSYDLDTEYFIDISHFSWDMQIEIPHIVYGLSAYDIKGVVGKYNSKTINEKLNECDEENFQEITGFPDNSYINNLKKLKLPLYLGKHRGFWNSKTIPNGSQFITEKYFSHNEDIIREDLRFLPKLTKRSKQIIEDMEKYDSVAVHFRRGEYKDFTYMGTCSIEYYNHAIKSITRKLKNPKLFVFTEDYDWVKENFQFDYPSQHIAYIPEKNRVGRGYADLLNVMSQCNHFIIANSTFSWWGSWLSQNEKKQIIYPKPWFHSQRVLGIDSMNSKKNNLKAIRNDYSMYFKNSNKNIFALTKYNFIDLIKQIYNLSIFPNDSNLTIEPVAETSSISLNKIEKNGEKSSIIYLKFLSNNKGFISLKINNHLDKKRDILTYNFYKNIKFETYIILPNKTSLNNLEVEFKIEDLEKDTKIVLKKFEINEIDNVTSSFSP